MYEDQMRLSKLQAAAGQGTLGVREQYPMREGVGAAAGSIGGGPTAAPSEVAMNIGYIHEHKAMIQARINALGERLNSAGMLRSAGANLATPNEAPSFPGTESPMGATLQEIANGLWGLGEQLKTLTNALAC